MWWQRGVEGGRSVTKVTLAFVQRQSGEAVRQTFPEGSEVIVGRAPGQRQLTVTGGPRRFEVRADLASLSEQHARITVRDGVVHVEDLRSRNGTLVPVEPGVPAQVPRGGVWLGSELTVRVEGDVWRVPEHLESVDAQGLCDLVRARLAPRGVEVTLGARALGTYRLTGESLDLVIRPADRNRTLDLEDNTWVQTLVNSWNAAHDLLRAARTWHFLAASPGRRRVLDEAQRAAPTDLAVILVGASGVGKSVLAQDLHDRSTAARGPFVAVSCAALGPDASAALFGVGDTPGLVEQAADGTLFLDGVHHLPQGAQVGLELLLSTGRVMREGDAAAREVTVRVLSSCPHEPRMVQGFRESLYPLLAAVRLDVPDPTPEDLARLAREFLHVASTRTRVPLSDDDVEALSALAAARVWPEHARDLRVFIDRLLASSAPAPEGWGAAWRALSRDTLGPVRGVEEAPLPVQPATVGRLLADAIFLSTALESRRRSDLARRLQMTYQGVDLRLRSLGVDVSDAEGLESRLQRTLAEIRATVGASPALRQLMLRTLGAGG